MASYTVNARAVARAKRMIDARQYVLESDWGEVQPVAEGRIRAVFFFVNPLSAHPHDPDIRTLLRVCNVHNVALTTNVAGADLFLASPLLHAGPEVKRRR